MLAIASHHEAGDAAVGNLFPAVALFSLAVVVLPGIGGRKWGRAKGVSMLALYALYWVLRPLFTGS